MNQAQVLADAGRKLTWNDIHVTSRQTLRAALIKKHGSLTKAAENLGIMFNRLNGAISGREYLIYTISAIQTDLDLTDSQVLMLWPLLKSWPKKPQLVYQ